MKLTAASLAVLYMALAVVPAAAQVLYDNGPINGNVDAWIINYGEIASDSFALPAYNTVNGFSFGTWEYPGDNLRSVDWSLTSAENSGTVYASGTVSGKNLTDTFLSTNYYGYDIDPITATGLNVGLTAGTYWLNLQNATVSSGDPVFWDENSGTGCQSHGCPSLASEGGVGTIPSEAFTIQGHGEGAPEPGSIVLFGSGMAGLAGVLRRKLF